MITTTNYTLPSMHRITINFTKVHQEYSLKIMVRHGEKVASEIAPRKKTIHI